LRTGVLEGRSALRSLAPLVASGKVEVGCGQECPHESEVGGRPQALARCDGVAACVQRSKSLEGVGWRMELSGWRGAYALAGPVVYGALLADAGSKAELGRSLLCERSP